MFTRRFAGLLLQLQGQAGLPAVDLLGYFLPYELNQLALDWVVQVYERGHHLRPVDNSLPRQDTEQELQRLDLVLHSEHRRCSADEVQQTAVEMDSFQPKFLALSPQDL